MSRFRSTKFLSAACLWPQSPQPYFLGQKIKLLWHNEVLRVFLLSILNPCLPTIDSPTAFVFLYSPIHSEEPFLQYLKRWFRLAVSARLPQPFFHFGSLLELESKSFVLLLALLPLPRLSY